MTVRQLKENFKNEFEGTLRVYNGREKADDSATLASIRVNDEAKGGEFVCRASRTVGKFKQELLDVFGIKVQVASPDDWVLVLDGITLANLKNIKKNAVKADMEELVAYKRKNTCESNNAEEGEIHDQGGLSNEAIQKTPEFKNYISKNPNSPFVFICSKEVDMEIDFSDDPENAIEKYIKQNNICGYGFVRIDNLGEELREIFGFGDVDECLREAVSKIANSYDEHEGWSIQYTEYVNCYHPNFNGEVYDCPEAKEVILYAQEWMMENYSNREISYDTVRGYNTYVKDNVVKNNGDEFAILFDEDFEETSFEWEESEDESITVLSNFLVKRLQEIVDEENKGYEEKTSSDADVEEDKDAESSEKITLQDFIRKVEFTIDYASYPAPNDDEDSPEYQEWEDEIETIQFTIDPDYTQKNGYDMDEGFWDSLCDCNPDVDTSAYLYADEDGEEEIEYTFDEIASLLDGELAECIIRAALNAYSIFIDDIDFPIYNVHAELEYKEEDGEIYYESGGIIEEVSFE